MIVFQPPQDSHFPIHLRWLAPQAVQTKAGEGDLAMAVDATGRGAVQGRDCAGGGIAASGRDNGAPGECDCHPGFCAAFLRAPDGNNVEAVYHGAG